MLRNLGIRWQILAALVVPLLVLIGVGGVLTFRSIQVQRESVAARELAEAAPTFNKLIVNLGIERLVAVSATLGQPLAQAQLTRTRSDTDKLLAEVRNKIYGPDRKGTAVSEQFGQALAQNEKAHEQIPAARKLVDGGKASADKVIDAYNAIIIVETQLPATISTQIENKDLATTFARYGAFGDGLVGLGKIQLAGVVLASSQRVSLANHDRMASAVAEYQSAQRLSRIYATPSLVQLSEQALNSPTAKSADYQAMVKRFLATLPGGATGVTGLDWIGVSTAQTTVQTTILNKVSTDGIAKAVELSSHSERDVLLTSGGSAATILAMLLIALLLARRISMPLRRLTLAATQIRDELPHLVAQVQAGDDFEIQAPSVGDQGRNEVGKLAAAFVDVNAVTVQIAREQVELRNAVGDMFVNIARRNQVLLARQLSFIDQLERNEADPDALEDLFRLDHLATRMRRNAESLLVLAGIESGRRLRDAMALSDVLRTATSEIEHYERVSLVPSTNPPVYAHLALPVAHMVAELVENSTNFSDPSSTVVVTASGTGTGVRITIADEGLGMPKDEIAEINARIVNPPTAEALGSQRLGFFVVGRIAQRLDATVTVQAGRARGTLVVIDLPSSLFVGHAEDAPRPATPQVEVPHSASEIAGTIEQDLPEIDTPELPAALDGAVEDQPYVPALATEAAAPILGRRETEDAEAAAPVEPYTPEIPEPAVAPDDEEETWTPPVPVAREGGGGATSFFSRRTPQAVPEEVAEEVAAEAAPSEEPEPEAERPNSSLFSGFRSRREAKQAVADAAGTTEDHLDPQVAAAAEALADAAHDAEVDAAVQADVEAQVEDLTPLADAPIGDIEATIAEEPVIEHVEIEDVADWEDDASGVADEAPKPWTPGLAPSSLSPELTEETWSPAFPSAATASVPTDEPAGEGVDTDRWMTDWLADAEASGALTEDEDAPYVPTFDSSDAHGLTARESELRSFNAPPALPAPDAAETEVLAPVEEPELPSWDAPTEVSAAQSFRDLAEPATEVRPDAAPEAPAASEPRISRPPAIDILPKKGGVRAALSRGKKRPAAVEIPKPGRPMVLSAAVDEGISRSLEQLETQEFAAASVPSAREGGSVGDFVDAPVPAAEAPPERSQLASEALSELSRLSSYMPASVATTDGKPTLTRRQPAAMPSLPEPEEEKVAGRTRTAASVRAMLSGFKAGVERGRTSPSAHRPAQPTPGAVPQPRQNGPESADE